MCPTVPGTQWVLSKYYGKNECACVGVRDTVVNVADGDPALAKVPVPG